MASDLNLASPDTSITVTIGDQPFSSSLDFTADPVAISLTGLVLEVKNTPVPAAPSTILVDEASDILVSVSSSPVENTIEISSTDLPSVSVAPADIPEITVFDSQSLIFNLIDLDDIVGQPDDGDIIVFDGDTNTFIFDSNAGQGGSLSADVEVTNLDDALGDAIGMTYQEGASIQGIVRDILEPSKPFISHIDLELGCLGTTTSSFVPRGASFTVSKLDLFFDRKDSLVAGTRVKLYYNGNLLAQSSPIPEEKPEKISITAAGASNWASSDDLDFLEVQVIYNDDLQYFSRKIPIYRVTPMGIFPTSLSDDDLVGLGEDAFLALNTSDGRDYDGGHTRHQRVSLLQGSVFSEDPSKSLIISIPSNYDLDVIAEVTGDVGTADMTNSFSRIGDSTFTAYNIFKGVDEYSVYLYRSNQTGALKSKSSLRVKVL